ncbi:MAG: hypothetical protein IPI67_25795 [Myxococcales bacterium]|nr:hypothetical protein [Myxococcales bacterium]
MRALSLLLLGLVGVACKPDGVSRTTPDGTSPLAPAPAGDSSARGAPAALPTVELSRDGALVKLDEAARRALIARVEKALGICNFSSDTSPKLFGADPLDEQWKRREAAAHLRLSYPVPRTLTAIAGALSFREVLLSIGQPYGPEPALIRDERGVVGLKKCGYDDRFLGCVPELAAHFAKPEACPPGF